MTAAVLAPTGRDINWTRVVRAQAGDREAFADIYRTYRPQIAGWIYKRTSDAALTEDLTHDVFTRALRHIGSVAWQGKDISAWLHTIARNRLADHYKSARVRLAADHHDAPIADLFDGWVQVESCSFTRAGQVDEDPMSDPQHVATVHLARADLIDALKALPVDYRRVIVLRYLNDLTLDETARAMGRSKPAIKMLQHRALQAMSRDEHVAALAGAA